MEAPVWPWPGLLTYENARIPALSRPGARLAIRPGRTAALEWLLHIQTKDGLLVPIGNRGWYQRGGAQATFDQQPIEADAMVAACCEAYGHTADSRWLMGMATSFAWFTGQNVSGLSLCDPETGGCRDGIGPDGLNQNQGAESTLAWLCASLSFSDLAPVQRRPQTFELSR
jgi:hypothetical protein